MTNYANIENRSAWLSNEFGEELARKWFGDETIESLPRFQRGPRKGKLKGAITWTKVLRGGWVSTGRETASGSYSGYVETRVGHIFDRKLHELSSDRYGASVGKVIRDLDREEADIKYKNSIRARIDAEIRKLEMERVQLEAVILSIDLLEVITIINGVINEKNADIAALVSDLQK